MWPSFPPEDAALTGQPNLLAPVPTPRASSQNAVVLPFCSCYVWQCCPFAWDVFHWYKRAFLLILLFSFTFSVTVFWHVGQARLKFAILPPPPLMGRIAGAHHLLCPCPLLKVQPDHVRPFLWAVCKHSRSSWHQRGLEQVYLWCLLDVRVSTTYFIWDHCFLCEKWGVMSSTYL
jgi:hypothetical protein